MQLLVATLVREESRSAIGFFAGDVDTRAAGPFPVPGAWEKDDEVAPGIAPVARHRQSHAARRNTFVLVADFVSDDLGSVGVAAVFHAQLGAMGQKNRFPKIAGRGFERGR
ncbi:hypothetical protein [Massilia sp. CF038]|uniref:hypothetical protein n=1 Tax=Massilia sp. CF038 TaxID=1881045 RepID=UPI000933A798|nr:hypothetical protein [Massilia sp. CF038]